MCRWFAYISPDVLIDPANALAKQCSEHYLPGLLPHGEETELDDSKDALLKMRNSLLNMDGLGGMSTLHVHPADRVQRQ